MRRARRNRKITSSVFFIQRVILEEQLEVEWIAEEGNVVLQE